MEARIRTRFFSPPLTDAASQTPNFDGSFSISTKYLTPKAKATTVQIQLQPSKNGRGITPTATAKSPKRKAPMTSRHQGSHIGS
jgi:hypothetical protein